MSDTSNYYRLVPPMQDYYKMLNFSSLPSPYGYGYSGMYTPGGLPSPFAFTGMPTTQSSSAAATANTSSSAVAPQSKEQAEQELQELFAQRSQLAAKVEVNTPEGSVIIDRAAYSEKTGYIAEDGKNDGKISFWNALKNIGKGCVNLVTDMFFDENGHLSLKKAATTFVVGGALAVAAFLIPGAGTVLAGAALASGVLTLGTGVVQAASATTDEGAEIAWQNIGSGTLQTVLSAVGLRKVGVNAAGKLGVEAPKIWRLDQSFKLGLKAARADINAAGGMSKAIGQNFNNMKIGIDRFVNKFGYSHYENKYTNNVNKLKTDIPGAGPEYRQYADDIAAAYEKVYSAQSKAEYTQAVNELQHLSNAAKAYRSGNTGLSDEAAAAFDDMIKISESVAPKNAYAIRTTKFGGAGDYAKKMTDLDAQINQLRSLGSSATPEQKFQLRILTRLKAASRELYRADSQIKQEKAIARFEQIASEALTEMQNVRNNPGTTADVLKTYNDIAIMAKDQAANVSTLVEARAADLTRAAKILDDKMATPADKANARGLIDRYLTNRPADNQAYISSVENIINTLKIEKKPAPILDRIFLWPGSQIQKGKNGLVKCWNVYNHPEVYMATTFNRVVYPQSIFGGTFGTKVENSQIDAQINEINKRINQLQTGTIAVV